MQPETAEQTAAAAGRAISGPAAARPSRARPARKAASYTNGDRSGLHRFLRQLGAVVIFLALVCSSLTFAIFTGFTPIQPDSDVIKIAVGVNFAFVVALLLLIMREAYRLIKARLRGEPGSRLNVRVVGLFSIVAAVPAILLAIVASVTLDRGLDRWFSDRTRAIVETSISVAQAYLREHGQVIRADIVAMAGDFDRTREILQVDPRRMQDFINAQANIRAVASAFIIKGDRTIVFKAEKDGGVDPLLPPPEAIQRAEGGSAVVIAPGQSDQVGAVIKLRNYDDLYLFVTRKVDQQVISYLQRTKANFAEFRLLEQGRFGVQFAFALVYIGFALVLMLSAILLGIRFADRLVAPIRRLIDAADGIAQGKLDVRVPVQKTESDLAMLSSTFNNMTGELRTQRNELLRANTMLDGRRRFMEAVLSGVTAGVIGVGREGKVTVVNRSAMTFLGPGRHVGLPIEDVLPEISSMISQAEAQPRRIVRGEIALTRGEKDRTIAVRVSSEQADPSDHSLVVTLDDISDLVSAQRSAAWADVARRIAHEIKNPLTPIQLSAERLRRKYGKKITEDKDIFEQCIETIVRQVGDIGRMVDEFSSFARMPKPTFANDDVADIVRQTVFMMRVGNPEITIETRNAEEALVARCDRRLISQALTNVVKNATEAVTAISDEERGGKGKIVVAVETGPDWIDMTVTDNGVGLPAENRERLLEPYMTTREKGTGLGLAIVSRIMEEHGGFVSLEDAPAVADGGRGARVRLRMHHDPSANLTKSDQKQIADASLEPAQ
ncbi:ATP-binding protein [Tepidamorphus sp. 3E244]|uniref:sensor histidine kinase NtrY-like n=1 Tax=Tepidamorphus sp. 3E244 TaxID=3385498 RepID=UPI0038FCF48B